jgi:hypothetical protein
MKLMVVDIKLSAVYTALVLNKPAEVKYLSQEECKTIPGKINGNMHLISI